MGEKRNVWIINQYTSTPLLGGGGNRSYHIAKELSKQNCTVTLITASYSHVPKRNYSVKETFHIGKEDDINLVVVKNIVYESGRSIKRIISMLIFWLRLYRLPVRKLHNPDFIIVSSISLLPILNAFYYKKRLRKKPKIILEIRDIWPLSLVELGNFSRYNPFVMFLSWVEKHGYQNADYLTSVLPLAYKHFNKITGRKVKFKHISNGIHLESIDPMAQLDPEIDNQIPKDKFVVGYTGALGVANAMQNFIDLAKECKSLDEFFFVIVGDGYEKNYLQNLSSNLNNILFLPRIRKKQVQSILSLFDVLYLCWSKKGLYEYGVSANKIFDYMYAAKPILMVGNIPKSEVEKAQCGIIVRNNDLNETKLGLISLKEMDHEEREFMGLKGKEFVVKNRTYEELALTYVSIFNELSAQENVRY